MSRPYILSSSDVVAGFVSRMCSRCEAEREYRANGEREGPCPIITRALEADLWSSRLGPAKHPAEIVIDDEGRGVCTAFELTDVRVDRLQALTREDAIAEGCPPQDWYRVEGGPEKWFRTGWDELNGARGYPWLDNPWVWVLTFRVAS